MNLREVETLEEIRNLLKEISQKLSHLLEQNRVERMLARGSKDFEEKND